MLGTPLKGWPRLIAVGVTGLVIGLALSTASPRWSLSEKVVEYPSAYQLPRIPGGTSLRIAMIHDVLLERYLPHGQAWYERRDADSQAIIAAEKKKSGAPSDEMLSAMDDLAVGLEHLHRSDEAIAVMRKKLAILPDLAVQIDRNGWERNDPETAEIAELSRIDKAKKLSPVMLQQYTARANLGTSLIHGSFASALAGDKTARKTLEEGLRYIEESIEINPGAHFGREKWQAIAVRYLLACIDDPGFLSKFDMVGDKWQEPFQAHRQRFGETLRGPVKDYQTVTLEERVRLRQRITPVGVDPEWLERVHADLAGPVAFDEPVLAIMGMWMFGGGPNPYSAATLARIGESIGQGEIAWDGYERALELHAPEALAQICRERQQQIAQIEDRDDPLGWEERTRKRHQGELSWAMAYQAAYHDWEARQIAAGAALDDPAFYEGLFKGRKPLASPVSDLDWQEVRFFNPDGVLDRIPLAALVSGALMMVAAVTERRGGNRAGSIAEAPRQAASEI